MRSSPKAEDIKLESRVKKAAAGDSLGGASEWKPFGVHLSYGGPGNEEAQLSRHGWRKLGAQQ